MWPVKVCITWILTSCKEKKILSRVMGVYYKHMWELKKYNELSRQLQSHIGLSQSEMFIRWLRRWKWHTVIHNTRTSLLTLFSYLPPRNVSYYLFMCIHIPTKDKCLSVSVNLLCEDPLVCFSVKPTLM